MMKNIIFSFFHPTFDPWLSQYVPTNTQLYPDPGRFFSNKVAKKYGQKYFVDIPLYLPYLPTVHIILTRINPIPKTVRGQWNSLISC